MSPEKKGVDPPSSGSESDQNEDSGSAIAGGKAVGGFTPSSTGVIPSFESFR